MLYQGRIPHFERVLVVVEIHQPHRRLCSFYIWTLFLTHIRTWGGTAKVHLDKSLKLQKHAVRIFTGFSYLEHTKPLFKQLEFYKDDEIRRYSCCIYVIKIGNCFKVTQTFTILEGLVHLKLNSRDCQCGNAHLNLILQSCSTIYQ